MRAGSLSHLLKYHKGEHIPSL